MHISNTAAQWAQSMISSTLQAQEATNSKLLLLWAWKHSQMLAAVCMTLGSATAVV